MPKASRYAAVCSSFATSLFCLLLSAPQASAQIQGYGKDATGGAGGSVCTVTTSAVSGTGSFSSCLSQGNRTIQFAVASATVGSTQYVKGNTTIDGCANGQNGVTIDQSGGTGRSVIIEGPVSNIIVRCLRFQGPAGSTEGSDLLGLDGTGGQISRVAVERSTFVGAADGALDITGDVSDMTVQNSLFYGTVLTQLIKYDTRMRISIHHNIYTAGGERNPQIKGDATAFDWVSNVVHANTLSADSYGTLLWNANSSSDSPGNIQINMVANAYIGTNGTIDITTESGASASGIYIASNNYCSPASNCPPSPASSPQFTAPAANAVTVTLPACMAANMLPIVGAPNRTATDTQRINAVAAALPTNCGGPATPTLSMGDASVTEGNAGTTTATFTATLSPAATGTVTVNYATANGTATAGSDYIAASGTLSFPAGTTSRPITVTVNGDTAFESNETFVVNLSTPSGATLADAQGVGTISNDDSCTPVQISIADQGVAEGNTGTRLLTFPVTLNAASSCTVTVSYATANGTATAGTDYSPVAGTLSFAPGVTAGSVTVSLFGDKIFEANETFLVTLSAPSGATLADAQAVGTLTNDDAAGFSVNDVTVVEPVSGTVTATFSVTLAPTAAGATSVTYATANGTATAPADYVTKTGTLTFAPGVTSQTVSVVVNADSLREAIETFVVNLAAPTGGAAIADPQGTARIFNPGAFFTVTPCRLVDTRTTPNAASTGPALNGSAVRTFTLAGACGIPANARALVLNVTTTSPTAPGDLRIYAAGVANPPLASVINYAAGQTRANNQTVNVNAGQITVRCDQAPGTTVHFILDVAGYYL